MPRRASESRPGLPRAEPGSLKGAREREVEGPAPAGGGGNGAGTLQGGDTCFPKLSIDQGRGI